MTERDLYVSCILMIAEMIVRCRKLSGGEYEDWKRETMEHCHETVKEFMGKVLIVIDNYVLEAAGIKGCKNVAENCNPENETNAATISGRYTEGGDMVDKDQGIL